MYPSWLTVLQASSRLTSFSTIATEAAKSYRRALELVTNESERRFLERRLREVQLSPQ